MDAPFSREGPLPRERILEESVRMVESLRPRSLIRSFLHQGLWQGTVLSLVLVVTADEPILEVLASNWPVIGVVALVTAGVGVAFDIVGRRRSLRRTDRELNQGVRTSLTHLTDAAWPLRILAAAAFLGVFMGAVLSGLAFMWGEAPAPTFLYVAPRMAFWGLVIFGVGRYLWLWRLKRELRRPPAEGQAG